MALSDNYPLVQIPGGQGVTHIFCRRPRPYGGRNLPLHIHGGAKIAFHETRIHVK